MSTDKQNTPPPAKRYPIEAYILCVIAIAATIIMTAEIVGRYAFQRSFAWSEEIVRYAFIWFTMIGASYAIKERTHICIEGVLNFLPKTIKKTLLICGEGLLLITLLFLFYKSLDYTLFTMKTVSRATVTKVPMFYIYAGMPLGFLLSCYRLIEGWVIIYRKRHSGEAA